MPNLSNMLGDVYGRGDDPDPEDPRHATGEEPPTAEATDSAETEAAESGDKTPEWASEDRLDAAFGDWTAGELPDTEADEREDLDHLGEEVAPRVRAVAAGELDRPPASPPKPAPAGIQMSDFTSVAPEPEPEPAPVAAPLPAAAEWHRGDDDILPGGGRRGLGRLLGR